MGIMFVASNNGKLMAVKLNAGFKIIVRDQKLHCDDAGYAI